MTFDEYYDNKSLEDIINLVEEYNEEIKKRCYAHYKNKVLEPEYHFWQDDLDIKIKHVKGFGNDFKRCIEFDLAKEYGTRKDKTILYTNPARAVIQHFRHNLTNYDEVMNAFNAHYGFNIVKGSEKACEAYFIVDKIQKIIAKICSYYITLIKKFPIVVYNSVIKSQEELHRALIEWTLYKEEESERRYGDCKNINHLNR